jgi:tRNA pseudouridine(55) synthase
MKYVMLDKPIGKTPLETIQEWKAANPEYAEIPASYAGRLDPMASGMLLVLLGDECKKKDEYIGLDKEYEIEILLGVGSDTGDILGIVHAASPVSAPLDQDLITKVLKTEIGSHSLPYPAFSSKTVGGKSLFMYALEGSINSITIPEHIETIYDIKFLGLEEVPLDTIKERISSLLARAPKSDEPSKQLGADFRIDAVRSSWDVSFEPVVVKLRVSCGSGAYMRTLAQRIGQALGTEALALSIHRTRIGAQGQF